MDDEEVHCDGDSGNVEGDDDFDLESEENNYYGSMSIGEDVSSSDDDIEPVILVKAFKHFKGLVKSHEKKGKLRGAGVEKRTSKNTRDEVVRGKGKSTVGCSMSGTAGSRCNNVKFGEIVGSLGEDKKKVIRDHGFGSLLEYDGCPVPRRFVQWLSNQVDVNCWDIVVGGQIIPFSSNSVHLFLGIPIGGQDISEKKEAGTSEFLEKINETKKPLIKSFVTKLVNDSLSDEDVAYYLDFLDFGSRHQIAQTLPRILCWKGNMIKKFSAYDCVSADRFGKRPVKSIEQTCYNVPSLPPDL